MKQVLNDDDAILNATLMKKKKKYNLDQVLEVIVTD